MPPEGAAGCATGSQGKTNRVTASLAGLADGLPVDDRRDRVLRPAFDGRGDLPEQLAIDQGDAVVACNRKDQAPCRSPRRQHLFRGEFEDRA